MAKIDLKKQGFNKYQYKNIIDNKFKDLGVTNLNEALEQENTVDFSLNYIIAYFIKFQLKVIQTHMFI